MVRGGVSKIGVIAGVDLGSRSLEESSGSGATEDAVRPRARVLCVRVVRGGVKRACAYAALARVMERVSARVVEDREKDSPMRR